MREGDSGVGGLTAEQRRVLDVLLHGSSTYADVAPVLGLETSAVRRLAREAVVGLADPPPGAWEAELARVADRVLGNESAEETATTAAMLRASPALREWGRTVAGVLASMRNGPPPMSRVTAVPEAPTRGEDELVSRPGGVPEAQTRPEDELVSRGRHGAVVVGSWWLWALAGIVLVGALLRFLTLDVQSFGHDEAVTAGRVLHASLGATLGEVGDSERTPYLYYVLAWGWSKVFGTGEVGLRALSALFGTALIPVAYALGREVASRFAGLLSAGLVAVAPFLVYYSQEARAYALLSLLCGISLLFFARSLWVPSTGNLAGWAVASALALATHYFAAFLVVAEAAWLLSRAPGARGRVLVALAPVAVVGASLLPLLVDQTDRHAATVGQAPLARQLVTALTQFTLGERLGVGGVYTATPIIGLAWIAVLGALLWRAGRAGRQRELAVGAVGAFAMLAPALLAVVGPTYFNARNVIVALPALLVVIAAEISSLRPRPALALAGATATAALAVTVAADFTDGLQRPDWRATADQLRAMPLTIAIAAAPGGDDPLLYYLRDRDAQRLSGVATASTLVAADADAKLRTVHRPHPRIPIDHDAVLATLHAPRQATTLLIHDQPSER